jgi:hypothetical protein
MVTLNAIILQSGTINETWKGKGCFLPLHSGTASAHVMKKSTESKVIIKIAPIKKEVTFDVDNNSSTQDTSFPSQYPCLLGCGLMQTSTDVLGNLMFKKLSDLKSGMLSVVNYNNDRILFYPTNGQQAMHAVVGFAFDVSFDF